MAKYRKVIDRLCILLIHEKVGSVIHHDIFLRYQQTLDKEKISASHNQGKHYTVYIKINSSLYMAM